MMMNVITFTCYKVENFRFFVLSELANKLNSKFSKHTAPVWRGYFRTISLGRLPTAADGTDDQNIFSLIVTLTKVELTKSFVESLNHFRSKANLKMPLQSKRTSCDSPVNL